MVWDELDKPLRKKIARAVRRGEVMDDPGHVAIATGLAIRRKRELVIQVVLFFSLGVVMTISLWSWKPASLNTSFWLAFFVAVGYLVLSPATGIYWHRPAVRAERANRQVVMSAGGE